MKRIKYVCLVLSVDDAAALRELGEGFHGRIFSIDGDVVPVDTIDFGIINTASVPCHEKAAYNVSLRREKENTMRTSMFNILT
jgi:hypothetical protein